MKLNYTKAEGIIVTQLDVRYPQILSHLQKYIADGRTESRSFLMWFLENYLRLDEVDAVDAVCDGPDDKGVDGIFVDDNLEQIVILQAKLVQNDNKTLGDSQLKNFYGTLSQFGSSDRISRLAQSTSNNELRNIIDKSDLAKNVENGYQVVGVFVTNIPADENARAYLETLSEPVQLYDQKRLVDEYVPSGPSSPQGKPVTLDLFGYGTIEYRVGDTMAIFAPIAADELLKLDGLDNGELFVWNVRRSLGRTKVNKEIAGSIRVEAEHKYFLLYHNGITILTQDWDRDGDKLTIKNYTVVNGAQSLTSLYENRSNVTGDLRILARIILLKPETELAFKITHHSNNQNAINARDLQSNSALQRRLQNEFAQQYTNQVFYRIQRGEESNLQITIDNEDAARIMLAFDLEQPWTAHQTYKLFDELHSAIFARPEVNANRIYALHLIQNALLSCLDQIEDQMLGKYRLTRYFLLYVLKLALASDEMGKRLVMNPGSFLLETNGEKRLEKAIRVLLTDLIVDLNAEIKERKEKGQPFDYKREFKSPTPVRELARAVFSPYQKAVNRGRATSFTSEWLNV